MHTLHVHTPMRLDKLINIKSNVYNIEYWAHHVRDRTTQSRKKPWKLIVIWCNMATECHKIIIYLSSFLQFSKKPQKMDKAKHTVVDHACDCT